MVIRRTGRTWLLLLPAACGGSPESAGPAAAPAAAATPVPESYRDCAECHPTIVRAWLENGMADALGPLPAELPVEGAAGRAAAGVANPQSGFHYRVEGPPWQIVEGGPPPAPVPSLGPHRRAQPLGFRIGAGVAATSFVARSGPRWWFAPLELFDGAGWVLAPAEQRTPPAGLSRPITSECLACHTNDPLPEVYPRNALGDLAPRGIDCAACHGDGAAHAAKMREPILPGTVYDGDSAILNPADLPAERQLDLCARCHLQGDARIELAPAGAPPFAPGDDLFARRAVFVAAHAGDDFGFVSQVERLALSACFQKSPAMSCTSCHDPHRPARLMERGALIAACRSCHPSSHSEPSFAGGGKDCLQCHMRRSQPFDLGHVQISDHWIRKTVPPPESDRPIRELESTDGKLRLFQYRTQAPPRYSARERAALEAMALAHVGAAPAALPGFDLLPPPGSAAAIEPSPEEAHRPWPLLRLPMLHFQRAYALEQAGRRPEAEAAYRDALRLDPRLPEARHNLAKLLAETGRVPEARELARALAGDHPAAESPWNLLALIANQEGKLEDLAAALRASLERHPDQAAVWRAYGQTLESLGDPSRAQSAYATALRLDPFLPPPQRR